MNEFENEASDQRHLQQADRDNPADQLAFDFGSALIDLGVDGTRCWSASAWVARMSESRLELDKILARYSEAKLLEEFIKHIEVNLTSIDETGRERLKTLIEQARLLINGNNIFENFMDWRSPLDRIEDK